MIGDMEKKKKYLCVVLALAAYIFYNSMCMYVCIWSTFECGSLWSTIRQCMYKATPTCSSQVFGQAQSPSLCALVEEEEGGGGPTTYAAQLEEGNRSLECEQEEPLDEEDMRDRELVYRQPLRRSDKEEAEAVEEEMTKRKVVSPSQVLITSHVPSSVA